MHVNIRQFVLRLRWQLARLTLMSSLRPVLSGLLICLIVAGAQAVEVLDGNVRLILDAEGFDAARPTTLVVYAIPNGNSAEQTLGGKGDGLNWHFDIQHI